MGTEVLDKLFTSLVRDVFFDYFKMVATSSSKRLLLITNPCALMSQKLRFLYSFKAHFEVQE